MRLRWGRDLIGVGVGIGIGVEKAGMAFGHEKLEVYWAAIEYVGWAYRYCENLKGHRNAKDQLLCASQAIPLNIAEGNGKGTDGARRRYFEIARGSALECGAVQDVLQVFGGCRDKRMRKPSITRSNRGDADKAWPAGIHGQ